MYYVYAVELGNKAARRHRDRLLIRKGARVYYVGQTGKTDVQRLLTHLKGGRASNRSVRLHAKKLVGHEGPFATRDEAERQERIWATKVRRLGHVVISR